MANFLLILSLAGYAAGASHPVEPVGPLTALRYQVVAGYSGALSPFRVSGFHETTTWFSTGGFVEWAQDPSLCILAREQLDDPARQPGCSGNQLSAGAGITRYTRWQGRTRAAFALAAGYLRRTADAKEHAGGAWYVSESERELRVHRVEQGVLLGFNAAIERRDFEAFRWGFGMDVQFVRYLAGYFARRLPAEPPVIGVEPRFFLSVGYDL